MAGSPILRCYITPDLRDVLPAQEDSAFLARLQGAVKDRLGPGADALLDYSRIHQPEPVWPHRFELPDGAPWPDPDNAGLAQEMVVQAFNRLFC